VAVRAVTMDVRGSGERVNPVILRVCPRLSSAHAALQNAMYRGASAPQAPRTACLAPKGGRDVLTCCPRPQALPGHKARWHTVPELRAVGQSHPGVPLAQLAPTPWPPARA